MKPYCASCGSTQHLKHLGDCTDWKTPIIWPAPLEPEAPQRALESRPDEVDFALIEAVTDLELEQVLGRLVAEGKLEQAGVNADGQPRYRRIPRA